MCFSKRRLDNMGASQQAAIIHQEGGADSHATLAVNPCNRKIKIISHHSLSRATQKWLKYSKKLPAWVMQCVTNITEIRSLQDFGFLWFTTITRRLPPAI